MHLEYPRDQSYHITPPAADLQHPPVPDPDRPTIESRPRLLLEVRPEIPHRRNDPKRLDSLIP